MNPATANRADAEPDSLDAFHELAEAARYYLDMLYACDPDMVDGIFHPQARLCTLEAGVPVFRSVEEYKAVLRARTSPASLGAPREDQCLMLDLASPALGLVKVKMRVGHLVFIDYLGLIRLEEGWRIVSKTYYRLA